MEYTNMYFLSDQRRTQLICRLVNLSMPVILAQECARYQNSVVEIDRRMAFLLCGLIERFSELVAATERRDEGRMRDLQAYVEADLIIFGTYQRKSEPAIYLKHASPAWNERQRWLA